MMDLGGQYGGGDDDDAALQAAYHESRRYSRDQYSAGGPAGSAYGMLFGTQLRASGLMHENIAYEPEPEEAPARVEEHITGTQGEYEPLDPRKS